MKYSRKKSQNWLQSSKGTELIKKVFISKSGIKSKIETGGKTSINFSALILLL